MTTPTPTLDTPPSPTDGEPSPLDFAVTGREEMVKVVGFTLARQEYVLDILKVKEIKLMLPITVVPNAPPALRGLANLRGVIVPVTDMRKKLNLPPVDATDETRIMVIELDSRLIGIIVDSVTESYDVRRKDISAPPSSLANIEASFVRGVARLGERLLIFLDIERILAL